MPIGWQENWNRLMRQWLLMIIAWLAFLFQNYTVGKEVERVCELLDPINTGCVVLRASVCLVIFNQKKLPLQPKRKHLHFASFSCFAFSFLDQCGRVTVFPSNQKSLNREQQKCLRYRITQFGETHNSLATAVTYRSFPAPFFPSILITIAILGSKRMAED